MGFYSLEKWIVSGIGPKETLLALTIPYEVSKTKTDWSSVLSAFSFSILVIKVYFMFLSSSNFLCEILKCALRLVSFNKKKEIIFLFFKCTVPKSKTILLLTYV